MNLIFRLLRIILRALRYRAGAFDPMRDSRIRFRVWPTDLDFNLHMNNARYLSLMDLGRVDLLNRLGLMRLAFRGHWFPVLGAAAIRYYRPLKLGNAFELSTRILGWDRKWFYLEQCFSREGQPVATAYVKGLIRGPDGSIPTADVLHSVAIDLDSPPLPSEARQLPE